MFLNSLALAVDRSSGNKNGSGSFNPIIASYILLSSSIFRPCSNIVAPNFAHAKDRALPIPPVAPVIKILRSRSRLLCGLKVIGNNYISSKTSFAAFTPLRTALSKVAG